MVKQPDVVALLSVGSAAQPKEDVLKIGNEGNKQLVAVKEEGEQGLSVYFQKDKNAFKGVLGPSGLPPLPTSRSPTGKRYEMLKEQAYPPRLVLHTQRAMVMRQANPGSATHAGCLCDTAGLDNDQQRSSLYIGNYLVNVHERDVSDNHILYESDKKDVLSRDLLWG